MNELLLLNDVSSVGRKGDIVRVKPGYARNFLFPKKLAVVADKNTLKLRARLQEERAKQAVIDKKESEMLAQMINGKVLTIEVKVDHAGHLYGSVSSADIEKLFEKEGLHVSKKCIPLKSPIKKMGVFPLVLNLPEDVPANFTLKVIPEGRTLEEFEQAEREKEQQKIEAEKKEEEQRQEALLAENKEASSEETSEDGEATPEEK